MPELLKCENGHILEPEAKQNSCNLCGANMTLFRCRQCDFDMCLKCARGVEPRLSQELMQRALPDYTATAAGANNYSAQKGNECLYYACGGMAWQCCESEAFYKWRVSIDDKGVEAHNDMDCLECLVGPAVRHKVFGEQFRVWDEVKGALLQEMIKHEVYQAQAEVQKAALAGGVVPAQEVMLQPQTVGKPAEDDLTAQLEKLAKLHTDGLLTQEEFQEAKKAALAKQAGAM